MEQTPSTKPLIILSAVASALAGIIHFWLAPIHWFHAPAHGIFFIVIGAAQVLWANAVWRRPTNRLFYIGALLSGWLIVLYAITRWLPSPFGHGPEAVDLLGVSCKVCELASMIPLVVLIFQGLVPGSGRRAAWQTVFLISLFAIVAGFATYTAARASEPYLPGLASPRGEVDHQESVPHEHHDEPHATPHEE
jgi:hypothetical protein